MSDVRRFAAQPAAPTAARHFVVEALRRWGHENATVDDAQLIVSELATNAVVHARGPFTVLVRAERSYVQLAVTDGSPATPTVRLAREAASSGHGLRLVEALASKWDVEPTEEGKTVWAELRR